MKPQSKPVYGLHLRAPRLTPWVPLLAAVVLSAPVALASFLLAIL